MKIKNQYKILSAACVLLLGMLGCKKELNDFSFDPSRNFMPGNIRITAGETNVMLEWNVALFTEGKPQSYTVQVAQDSLFVSGDIITLRTDRPGITITDSVLQIRTRYFARVRTDSTATSAASFWVTSNSFQIRGEQIFAVLIDSEVTDSSAILRWRPTPNLTRIVLTPAGGAPVTINLTADDVANQFKMVTGLTQLTAHTAEIFAGNVSKGTITFTTKEKSEFTIIITPADNLVQVVANAPAGSVIGLRAGVYNCVNELGEFTSLNIAEKTITIASFTNDPSTVQVNYREITLRGNGAGIITRGITWDGLAAGNNSLYYINLVGLNNDAEPATFTDILVENCVVTNMANSFFRGNRAANNAHKINSIKVNNCIVGDNRMINAWTFFTMDRLEFRLLELTNSTFYKIGRGLILYGTNFTVPFTPRMVIDRCTFSGLGRDVRNHIFIDNNANTADIEVSNCIIANAPMTGQNTGTSMMRIGAGNAVMNNTNLFNLTNGAATPAALTLPTALVQRANISENPGWTADANTFTLPANSPLRTASSNGGPIGDPRWAR